MALTALYCAVCGTRFEPDDNHVRVAGEVVWTDNRNEREEYVLHIGCWDDLTDEWEDPV